MKNIIVGLVGLFICFSSTAICAEEHHTIQKPVIQKSAAVLSDAPAAFEPNRGQAPAQYSVVAKGLGYWVGISAKHADLLLSHVQGPPNAPVSLNFVGATQASQPELLDPLKQKAAYFLDGRSIGGISTYGKIRYANMWPGIDVVYYGTGRQLEYDFVLAPGADPAAIHMQFDGINAIKYSPNGGLILQSKSEEIEQAVPVAYQKNGSARIVIPAKYKLSPGGNVAIELGNYDRSKELVIDPVLLYAKGVGIIQGTFNAVGVASDGQGNSYYAGATPSITIGNASYHVAFINEIDSTGATLVSASFGAQDGDTYGTGIAVDGSNNVYVTGYTTSPSGLFSNGGNGFQSASGGGADSFLVKFAPLNPQAPLSPLYGTYLGGLGTDVGDSVAASNNGMAYVVGRTDSANFPVGAPPALQNGFIVAINTTVAGSGSKVYSLALGGSGVDEAESVAVDSSSNAYVGGYTESADFQPLTGNGYQTTKGSPNLDGFLVKINSGGAPVWNSFFIGGPIYGVSQLNGRFAYAVGETTGAIVTTPNAYQPATGAGHGFFVEFDTTASSTSALVYSTSLGGGTRDVAESVAAAPNGEAYITGWTSSADFPITGSPIILGSYPGGHAAFLSFINPAVAGAPSLVYSTFLVSATNSSGLGVSADAYNQAAVALTSYDSNYVPNGGAAVKIGSQIFNSTFFVTQQYLDTLDRAPDQSGLNYWVGVLNSGTSRSDVAAAFFTSNEFSAGGLAIIKYYIAVLGRDPDFDGWLGWFNTWARGTSLDSILNSFLNSAEFTNTYGSLDNGQFVTLVYNNVLFRAPDSAGYNYWVNALNSGQATKVQVMAAFVNSQEFNTTIASRAYADLLYMSFLRRTPDPTGLQAWIASLGNANTVVANLPAVVNAFVTSPEYVERFE